MTVSRPPRLRMGDEVLLNGSTHVVVGVSATQVRLTDVAGTESVWSLADLFSSAGVRVLTQPRASLPPQGLLEGLPADVVDQARWWEDHIVEVITGVPPQAGARAKPRPQFDPSTRSLRQRELAGDGHGVPLSTLQRLRLNYEKRGVWGLVDQRVTGRRGTKTDERVLQAIGQAVAEETNRSTGTVGRLRRRLEQILVSAHGIDPASVMPARATFYRLAEQISAGRHTFGSARTRRSLAKRRRC